MLYFYGIRNVFKPGLAWINQVMFQTEKSYRLPCGAQKMQMAQWRHTSYKPELELQCTIPSGKDSLNACPLTWWIGLGLMKFLLILIQIPNQYLHSSNTAFLQVNMTTKLKNLNIPSWFFGCQWQWTELCNLRLNWGKGCLVAINIFR